VRGAAAVAAVVLLGSQPMAQDVALPDRETFLREVRAALARTQEVSHHFAYKERRTDLNLNPFGRMGTGETRVMHVYPSVIPQLTYKRLVERNGVALARHELDRQDAEYREKAMQVQQRVAREDESDRREREHAELLVRRRAQLMIEDVLGTMQFHLVRREVRDGVSTIVITFSAKTDAKPATREGRVAKAFKGSAWIHEALREPIHVEAVAVDDVAFGGFVAKLYEGTLAYVQRSEVEPGVWMPTRVKLSGEVRALFRRAKIDFLVDWFDYKRMGDASFPLHTRVQQ
jgi:hypothetical protein